MNGNLIQAFFWAVPLNFSALLLLSSGCQNLSYWRRYFWIPGKTLKGTFQTDRELQYHSKHNRRIFHQKNPANGVLHSEDVDGENFHGDVSWQMPRLSTDSTICSPRFLQFDTPFVKCFSCASRLALFSFLPPSTSAKPKEGRASWQRLLR